MKKERKRREKEIEKETLLILVGIVGENVASKTEKGTNGSSLFDEEAGCLVARSIYLAGGYNRDERTRGEAVEDCRRNLRYNENCLKVCTRGV